MQDNVKTIATVRESYDSRRKERKWIRGITLITLILTITVCYSIKL